MNIGLNEKVDDNLRTILKPVLKNIRILIIDEISMVTAEVLYTLHVRLQSILENWENYFGGVSLLFMGDFRQIEPFKGRPIYENPKKRNQILDWVFWEENVRIHQLTENVRQASDHRFQALLHRARIGVINDEDVALLNSRRIKNTDMFNNPIYPKDALQLYATNDKRKKFNCNKLMYDSRVLPSYSNAGFMPLGFRLKDGSYYEKDFQYTIPSKVMLIETIDNATGLVNGAMGMIVGQYPAPDVTRLGSHVSNAKVLFVKFEGKTQVPDHYEYARFSRPEFFEAGYIIDEYKLNLENCVAIGRYESAITGTKGSSIKSFLQFPLCLRYALTVFKSQGDTVNEVVIDFDKFMHGSNAYVAISRVTALEGLHVLGQVKKDKFRPNERTEREMNRLTTERVLCVPKQFDIEDNIFLLYMNIVSLNKHFASILQDWKFYNRKLEQGIPLIALTETHLRGMSIDDVTKDSEYYGINACYKNGQGGVAVLAKKGMKMEKTDQYLSENSQILAVTTGLYSIIVCYIRPKATQKSLKETLNRILEIYHNCTATNKIIVGDFNFSQKDIEKHLCKTISKNSLLTAEYTTLSGTKIDHAFGEFKESVSIKQHWTSYSDHSAFTFSWSKTAYEKTVATTNDASGPKQITEQRISRSTSGTKTSTVNIGDTSTQTTPNRKRKLPDAKEVRIPGKRTRIANPQPNVTNTSHIQCLKCKSNVLLYNSNSHLISCMFTNERLNEIYYTEPVLRNRHGAEVHTLFSSFVNKYRQKPDGMSIQEYESRVLNLSVRKCLNVRGDGSCLYHTFEIRFGKSVQTLRNEVATYLVRMFEQDPVYQLAALEETNCHSVEEYLRNVRHSNTWGGHYELAALSETNHCKTEVHTPLQNHGNYIFTTYRTSIHNENSDTTFEILYTGNHYMICQDSI